MRRPGVRARDAGPVQVAELGPRTTSLARSIESDNTFTDGYPFRLWSVRFANRHLHRRANLRLGRRDGGVTVRGIVRGLMKELTDRWNSQIPCLPELPSWRSSVYVTPPFMRNSSINPPSKAPHHTPIAHGEGVGCTHRSLAAAPPAPH